jgi:putative membrane protein
MKTANSKFEFRNSNCGFSSAVRGFAGIGLLGQYHEHYGMMGGWWMWIMWIVGFILFVFLVFLLASSFRNGGRGTPPTPRETPLDVLKKRYAAGEITREEYEQMRKDLER